MLLHGGVTAPTTFVDETWTWTLARGWRRESPPNSPGSRGGFGVMADYPQGGVTLLYGSGSSSGDDTWGWNGLDWQLLAPNGPSPRQFVMASWPVLDTVVLVSGSSPSTYHWDGSSWTIKQAATSPPLGFSRHAAAFDGIRVIAFGGNTGPSSGLGTWSYDLLEFSGSATNYGLGCPASGPARLVSQSGALPVVGQAFSISVHPGAGGAVMGGVLSVGVQDRIFGGFRIPVPLDSIGMNSCWIHTEPVLAVPLTGQLSAAISIPSVWCLLDQHIYLQAVLMAPSANPAGVITSDGLDIHIGRGP